MSKTIDEAVSGHPAAEAELEQLRNRVGQLQDQVGGDGRVVNSDKMREAIKGWLDANVHDGEDRSGASDVAYFTPDELQELVEECLEAVAVQRPVAEVIPNTVGVEMAWIDPRNKPPVGAKLYTLAQQPESDPRDGCELECGAYGTYCRCKDRAAYERQAQQPESEPVPFEVGGHYRTQVGKWVKFVKVHNQGTRHETMADENGVHRYTNRPGDMGRVTGTAHDYSDWRNTPPTYASPQPSAQVPDGWEDVLNLLFQEMDSRFKPDGRGNAPGHGHSVPGIWDSDNGDLAGKPCAWCAIYNKAKSMLTAALSIAEKREPREGLSADWYITDGMDYTEETPVELAQYHGDNMPLNSTETLTVECYHKLPDRDMRVSVDADGDVSWEWVSGIGEPPEVVEEEGAKEDCDLCEGSGDDTGLGTQCPECGGTGEQRPEPPEVQS